MKRTIALGLAALTALALAACADTVDSGDLENQLVDLFADSGNDDAVSAECPDDEKAEKGNEFTCTLTDDETGDSIDVVVTMTDDEGHFEAKPSANLK